MAIQYPKTEHVTLPSVEGFNGSFNILRDPPKSIFTKRIDKVGQNSDIINLIDESGDRAVEGISVYSRGVNPMVSVSYDNNSKNAGINTGSKQAFLPYRIMDRGAFRPPVRTQRDLLPLSRQPRAWFEAKSNPGFIDYTKQKHLPTQFRMIREILRSEQEIKPNKSVKIEKPIIENMKMKNAINEKHINIEGFSGKRSLDYSNFTRDNIDKYKGIQENYEEVNAITNKNSHRSHNLSGIEIDEDQYIAHKDYYESTTNPSLPKSHNLSDLEIDQDQYISHKDYYESTTNPSLPKSHNLSDLEIDQDQYIAHKDYYQFDVNKGYDINTKTIDELNSNNKTMVKDILQYNKDSGVYTGYTLLTENPDIELEENLHAYDVNSSVNDPTVYKRVEHQNSIHLYDNLPKTNSLRNVTKIEEMDNFSYGSSREYKLPEKIVKGEFENRGNIPTTDRSVIQFRMDSNKEKIRNYMNDTQFSRFNY